MKYWGKVLHGHGRGKLLLFPTVNLRLHRSIPEGSYISLVKYKGKLFESISFIGASKTFNDTQVFSETFIFNFSEKIYGKWISVHLVEKIRPNKKFGSATLLKKQIEKDIDFAKDFFRNKDKNN